MSSINSIDKSTLVNLFNLSPEAYRNVFHKISDIYRQDPATFINVFFDQLPNMNPKTVRIICYQLYTNGINLDQPKAGKLVRRTNLDRIDSIPKFLDRLDEFPLETIMTLLKYRFPAYPNGDIFFLASLNQFKISPSFNPYPSNLNWLNYTLDLCIHRQINLNHINKSTGSTCLHTAVRLGSLCLVQTLLTHRVDPNTKSIKGVTPLFAAIESLSLPEASQNYKTYLNMIRHLCRYGAIVDNVIKEQIKLSPYSQQINREISSGTTMKPHYSSTHSFYFSLDPIEDLVLIAEIDPSIIDDANFPPVTSEFLNSIQKKRAKTMYLENSIIGWPYYIDDTAAVNNQHCYLHTDSRVSASSPPNSDEVYKLALRSLPDIIQDVKTTIDLPTETPAAASPGRAYWLYDGVPPTNQLPLMPTFPLLSGPLLPTGNVQLPSI
ncbi:hypothetical protein BH23THE1_BH23THE1_33900 [soil metagenome]